MESYQPSLITIRGIREANARAGYHFFDPGTLRFFKSRIGRRAYGWGVFVTSEQGPDGVRRYSVRRCRDDGRIDTVGGFQAYASSDGAKAAAKRVAREQA